MKNGEILKLYEVLSEIANDPNQKFNIKISYTFAKNREKIKSEAILIFKTRQNILLEYGKQEENGDIVIPRDKLDEVNNKINELMDLESGLQIDQLCLTDLEGYELGMEQVSALMPMLYEPIMTGPPIFDNIN